MQCLQSLQNYFTSASQFTALNDNSTVEETFQKAINTISADFYHHYCATRGTKKNFMFFTPNLLTELSMLYTGSPESLQREIETALHMGKCKGIHWHTEFTKWNQDLQNRKVEGAFFKFQQVQIIGTKTLLTQSSAKLLDEYKPEKFHFDQLNEAKSKINQRVSEVTEGKIQNLIQDIPPRTALFLACASLFKGQWIHPFSPNETRPARFYNADQTESRVQMMEIHNKLRAAYDSSNKMCILELPFHGDFTMLLFKIENRFRNPMPVQNHPKAIEKYLSSDNLRNLLDQYDERFSPLKDTDIQVPKMHLQDESDFLTDFGNTRLVQQIKKADFAQSLLDVDDEAKVEQIKSKIDFEMDEQGATVAAASFMTVSVMSCPQQLTFDTPFAIGLVDKKTKTILGMGQISQL